MSDQPEAPESTDGTHEERGTAEETPTDRSANRRRPTGRDERDGSTGPSSSTGAGLLSGLVLGGVLGSAATGTASADSTGQVGTAGDPLTALYTAELNGPVTDEGSGPQAVTSLVGDGLTVESGALSAAPARPDVEDGSTSVSDAAELTFGQGLTVTDDGDGTATVGLDTRLRAGPKIHPNLRDVATRFGQSVALSGGGGTAIVGARTPDGGAAYVFAERGSNSFSWQTELTADDGDAGDRFGEAVAVSDGGGTVVVGAPRDEDPNGSFAGSAYVFADPNDDGTWTQQAKLTADDGDAGDWFGWSVALSDDGTTALVGAFRDEDPNGAEAGSAYVFADDGSGTWTQQNKLAASDGASNDRFATDLSLSGDGSVALVGAPLDDNTNGEFAGSAYIFTADVTGTLTQEDKLVAADAGNGDDRDEFGSSVSLSNDGTTALIGADRDEDPNGSFAGSAYVFADPNDDGTWTQQTKLSASDGDSSDRFGSAVSISDDGTTALVGARNAGVSNGPDTGRAYVFVDDGGWSQQDTVFASDGGDNDRFGDAVAISGDGATALAGAPRNEGPNGPPGGSAYTYRDGSGDGNFNRTDTLTAVDGDAGDRFGRAVALSGDGTTALVGAPDDEDPNGQTAGSAYLFAEGGAGWSRADKLAADRDGESDSSDRFSASVALSADGTTALVGAPDDGPTVTPVGRAYVFANDGGWSQQDRLSGGSGNSRLGRSVALSADGTTALVGAPRDDTTNGNSTGAVYVFVDDGTGTWNQQDTLVAGDIDSGDRLGRSVALSDDGTVALAGAPVDEDPNGLAAGSVYVFADDGTGTWTQQDKFAAGDAGNGDDGDRFGTAVALSGGGTTALVGAPDDEDPNGFGSGSVYVFVDDGTGTWSQRTKLTAIDADNRDNFGASVALVGNGTTALVGAPNDEDPNGQNSGSAYFFYETL